MKLGKLFSDHSGVGHMKGMAVIVGAAFVVLLLIGKPAGDAFVYALLLACPLMMVGMMLGGHGGHEEDGSDAQATRISTVKPAPVARRGPSGPHSH